MYRIAHVWNNWIIFLLESSNHRKKKIYDLNFNWNDSHEMTKKSSRVSEKLIVECSKSWMQRNWKKKNINKMWNVVQSIVGSLQWIHCWAVMILFFVFINFHIFPYFCTLIFRHAHRLKGKRYSKPNAVSSRISNTFLISKCSAREMFVVFSNICNNSSVSNVV